MLLSGFAYVLLSHLKMKFLKKSELKNAYVGTIRNQLLKIGAVIIKNT
ncbi:MAG: transposase, partial [Bacteroidota bacterium]